MKKLIVLLAPLFFCMGCSKPDKEDKNENPPVDNWHPSQPEYWGLDPEQVQQFQQIGWMPLSIKPRLPGMDGGPEVLCSAITNDRLTVYGFDQDTKEQVFFWQDSQEYPTFFEKDLGYGEYRRIGINAYRVWAHIGADGFMVLDYYGSLGTNYWEPDDWAPGYERLIFIDGDRTKAIDSLYYGNYKYLVSGVKGGYNKSCFVKRYNIGNGAAPITYYYSPEWESIGQRSTSFLPNVSHSELFLSEKEYLSFSGASYILKSIEDLNNSNATTVIWTKKIPTDFFPKNDEHPVRIGEGILQSREGDDFIVKHSYTTWEGDTGEVTIKFNWKTREFTLVKDNRL